MISAKHIRIVWRIRLADTFGGYHTAQLQAIAQVNVLMHHEYPAGNTPRHSAVTGTTLVCVNWRDSWDSASVC